MFVMSPTSLLNLQSAARLLASQVACIWLVPGPEGHMTSHNTSINTRGRWCMAEGQNARKGVGCNCYRPKGILLLVLACSSS